MYKIGVVEDEKEYQESLINSLHRIEKEQGEQFMVRLFNDGMDILDEYSVDYDLLLLDIKMKYIDGMETARRIREIDKDVTIIFITSLAQYAIEGYKVQAFDFILKPVKYEQFQVTINHALNSIKKWKKEKMLRVIDGNNIRKVSTNDIYYMEVINHDIFIHTDSEVVIMKNTRMRDMENDLRQYNYARANQSFLVNMKYISEIKGDEIILPNTIVFLSRSRKKDFIKQFAFYIGMEI